MAITFPIDAPLDDIAEVEVGEHNANSFITSPFTGRGVVQSFEGDYWRLTIGYRSLNRTLAQPVTAFVSSLRRSFGTFVIAFPGYDDPLGAAKDNPSSPTVSAGGLAGSDSVTIANGPASITDWLLPGDIIQIGPSNRPHWHRVLTNTDTDASGNATIDIWPKVRQGTIAGDAVVYTKPLCQFRLVEDVDTSLQPPVLHSMTLSCREAT